MRPALVRLVDLGLEDDFTISMSFAEATIQSLSVQSGPRPAEIEYIRTWSPVTVVTALRQPATVIHVMAHGMSHPDEVAFVSDDERTELTLAEMAEDFADAGHGLGSPVFIADCCHSAQGRFVRAIRDCLSSPTLYIGSTRSVNWHECTTFTSAFYAALFRDKGFGVTPLKRGATAARRAVAGYKATVAGPCPFKAQTLLPSRRAAKLLGGT